jgi:hypothetical protein
LKFPIGIPTGIENENSYRNSIGIENGEKIPIGKNIPIGIPIGLENGYRNSIGNENSYRI